ncbi:RidA family protein [Herbidospora daliensis]|uniref:RidA family protein n=1 Tax=Herbidospora daliensis TaxID=295585 RepID=UPI000780E400|nr:RidA family protein [Herbidospora daliensis]
MRLNPPTVPATNGRYSHAVRAGDLLFVSGQVAVDASGEVVAPGDMTAQTEVVYDHLRLILEDQGATFADVVHIRTFLTEMDGLLDHAAVRGRHVPSPPPASTTVEVSRLFRPGLVVEVELVADLAGSGR